MNSKTTLVRTFGGFLGLVLLISGVAVEATTNYWRGVDGDWGTASNWSENVVPDATTTVVFDDPLTFLDITLSASQDVAGMVFKDTMTSSVTIGGANNLIFRDGGVIIDVESGSAAHSITSEIRLDGAGASSLATLRNNSVHQFSISEIIRREGSASISMEFDGSGDFFFDGSGGGFIRQDIRTIDLVSNFNGQLIIDSGYEFRNTHPLTVDGGTIIIDGRTATRNANTGLVINNGLLTGHGNVGHIVTGSPGYFTEINNGGEVNPGRPGVVGSLEFQNYDVAFNAGSTLRLDLEAVGEYDHLTFAQAQSEGKVPALTLDTDGAGVNLALNLLPGFAAAIDDEFMILSGYDEIIGHFDGLEQGATFEEGGFLFQIDYGANDTVLTVVPEPSSTLLFLGGLLWFVMRRRVLFSRRT